MDSGEIMERAQNTFTGDTTDRMYCTVRHNPSWWTLIRLSLLTDPVLRFMVRTRGGHGTRHSRFVGALQADTHGPHRSAGLRKRLALLSLVVRLNNGDGTELA